MWNRSSSQQLVLIKRPTVLDPMMHNTLFTWVGIYSIGIQNFELHTVSILEKTINFLNNKYSFTVPILLFDFNGLTYTLSLDFYYVLRPSPFGFCRCSVKSLIMQSVWRALPQLKYLSCIMLSLWFNNFAFWISGLVQDYG